MIEMARRFFIHPSNWTGPLLIGVFVLVSLMAPWLAPLVPSTQPGQTGLTSHRILTQKGIAHIPQPPGPRAILGTTDAQEDVFYALVWGIRDVFAFSLKAALLAALIGVLLGAVSGWLGGWLGRTIMRVTDGFLTIPVIAGMIILEELRNALLSRFADTDTLMLAARGIGQISAEMTRLLSFDTLLWAIILLGWMPYARLTYAMTLRIKDSEYIQAARALGESAWGIIWRHLLPNAISPSVILLARDMGWVVILQASMAFAGFGSSSSWGTLLLEQRKWIIGAGGNPFGYWWVWLPITLALVLYGTGWNLLGDALNEMLNPRSQA